MTKRVVHHIMVGGQSGDSGSLMEKLNQDERRQLDEWTRTQQPRENGVIDLMRWPGWNEAARRMQLDMQIAWGHALDVIDRVKSRGIE
ncbi:hypothetical protein [Burkholderia arboris]|uniref:hypothetical protein n=1 Tax=Burkholderia arboris TaxID=488730 RepID=UPI001CF54751|nr:hypothetical protein [Burkholderia arboris]MCA8050769.1 hypothetical protein [Burkholderia arboris]CAJ6624889.1 Uncharacterised protein [Burkholderia pseudomallei]CAJ6706745.1 Uncharacterised protein [Burkholderia pseudomallei]